MSETIILCGGQVRLSADESLEPKWQVVAHTGVWHGYTRDGGKRTVQLTEELFAELVRNHRYEFPFDYEHASVNGGPHISRGDAPAAGWGMGVRAINRDSQGRLQLEVLTRWTPRAASAIRAEEYRWPSIVVKPNQVANDTGETLGFVLTSVAVTNTPFIEDLPSLVASRSSTDCAPRQTSADRCCMSESTLVARLAGTLRCREEEVASVTEQLLLSKESAEKDAASAKSDAAAAKGRFASLLAKLGLSDDDKLEANIETRLTEHKATGEELKRIRAAVKALSDADKEEAKAEAEAIAASRNMAGDAAFVGYVLSRRASATIDFGDGLALPDPEGLAKFRSEFSAPSSRTAPKAPGYATQTLLSRSTGGQVGADGAPVTREAGPTVKQAIETYSGNNQVEKARSFLLSRNLPMLGDYKSRDLLDQLGAARNLLVEYGDLPVAELERA